MSWLKEFDRATSLESAVTRVIKEGKVKAYEIGGKNSTLKVVKEVADRGAPGKPAAADLGRRVRR